MFSSRGLTDVGKRRSFNEDSIFFDDRLLVVCDGMGGHKAGEVASALAVDVLTGFVRRSMEDLDITWPFGFEVDSNPESNRLRTAVKLANRAVAQQAATSDKYTGMGTTVSVALVSADPPRVTYANVGDSRVYLIRGGAIEQLSRDDSWANLPLDLRLGDTRPPESMQHVLTKALGIREDVDFEVTGRDLLDGDVLLLCSDGLTNMIEDHRILEILKESRLDPDSACTLLVAEANENGGRDNISVVVLRYQA